MIFQIYVLYPGVEIKRSELDDLYSSRFGEKGDSQFVKTLLLRFFQVHELQGSTITGRVCPTLLNKAKDTGTNPPQATNSIDGERLKQLKRKRLVLFAHFINK